jgi:hypothetical protein
VVQRTEAVIHRFAKIALVAAGVSLASIATGAVAGIVCVIMLTVVPRGLHMPDIWILRDILPLLYAGAVIGGVCGLALGPVAILGFMRRVPLGRLLVEMCVGTIVGGSIGFRLMIGMNGPLTIAAVGFLGAGARLAWKYRAARSAPSLPLANTHLEPQHHH